MIKHKLHFSTLGNKYLMNCSRGDENVGTVPGNSHLWMTHNTAGFKQNFRMEPESDLGGLQTTIRGMKPTKVGVVYG